VHGKSCVPFSYKGVDYAAGQCTYVDSSNALPWCSFVANTTDFSLGAGDVNWDYCSDLCTPRKHMSVQLQMWV
jgi:hypothetical protein